MALKKPYQGIPIQDNGDRLVAIPGDRLALIQPHPYVILGAPYGDKSPFYLREPVVTALLNAQTHLEQRHPQWRIQIFDAYRPIPVQRFMVDYTFQDLAQQQHLDIDRLSPQATQDLWEQVHQFWAVPSSDPTMPPPHSTGAAVDVTLLDDRGNPIPMGCPIDECSPRAYPDHFAQTSDPQEQTYHHSRLLLRQVMTEAGFRNHPWEWWHFSLGDQLWAWLGLPEPREQQSLATVQARYGAI